MLNAIRQPLGAGVGGQNKKIRPRLFTVKKASLPLRNANFANKKSP